MLKLNEEPIGSTTGASGFVMGEWESSEEAWNALSNRLQAAIAKAEATA